MKPAPAYPTHSPIAGPAWIAILLACLLALAPAHAGTVLVSGTSPVAVAPQEVLYSQLEGTTSGKVNSFKKLFKDVELYPTDGSSALLMTFTLPAGREYLLRSMTLQIDPMNAVALKDNAAVEIALYRNDKPADKDFLASEVVASGERFDVSGLEAGGGSYFTFVFESGYTVAGGVQHGIALHWTLDSVAPDSILEDKLLFRFARTNALDVIPGEGWSNLNPEAMVAFSFPPDFSGFSSDDPVIVLIGEPQPAGLTWGGHPAVEGTTWVDTGGWLGWINVQGDWIYISRLLNWAYFPDPGADAGGGWGYIVK